MRRGLLLSLLLLLAGPAAAQACGPREGDTIARNGVVRVYSMGDDYEKRFRACLEPRGRPKAIWRGALTGGHPQNFRLAGRFVAYSWIFSDRYTGDQMLHVHRVDVRGRRTRKWSFYWCNCGIHAARPPGMVALEGLRLRPSGAFAFMAGPHTNDGGGSYVDEVWVNGQVVDSAPDLSDFHTAPGGGVRWLHAGEWREAALR